MNHLMTVVFVLFTLLVFICAFERTADGSLDALLAQLKAMG